MRKAHGCHRPVTLRVRLEVGRGFGLSEATVRKPRNMTPTLLGSPSQRRFAARPFIPLHRAKARLAPDLGPVAIHATNRARQMQTGNSR